MKKKNETNIEKGDYSVTEYAEKLGISRQAVLKKIKLERLPANVEAEKIGSTYIISVL